jgi:malate synthase
MAKVRADKQREARAGHDGTWIAHPGLAPVALEAFDGVMSGANQLGVLREDVHVTAADLLQRPEGVVTEEGVRHNIRVGIQYVEAWLRGTGCVPLYNLMEDAATAEISRAQLWQWLRHGVRLADGRVLDLALFNALLGEELERIHREIGRDALAGRVFPTATRLFTNMVTAPEFDDFLTLPAYDLLA